MKILENITLYKCEYCGKKYQLKHFCELHEKRCPSNPDNYMACINCENAVKKEMIFIKEVAYFSENYGVGFTDEERKINAFWCNAKNHWIYPATKCNNPILQENIIDEIKNEPMPKECNNFISIF